jgi:hypothetical protein
MATNIKYATVQSSSLDFDAIKASLKTYLTTQDIFKDYNFEGSSMNILLDVLASNTHYYALYNSMIANEMFLDSAILRSNVISNAKNLGYTPRSNLASSATVKLEITTKNSLGQPISLGNYVSVPKGTQFNSSVNDTAYRFVTTKEYLLDSVGPGLYSNSDIEILEGVLLKKSFTVTTDPGQKFQILDQNIDTTSIKLWIQESQSNLTTVDYNLTTSILGLSSSSTIFMIQESGDGNYEIVFGDGIIGKKPVAGNIITIEYLSTSPGESDGCNTFSLVQLIVPGQTHAVTTIKSATGSSTKETIESIKIHAKYNFEAQGRAVIPTDYKTIIMQKFPDMLDVNVWGGENNDPPQYGKVFISPLSRHLSKVTTTRKDEIVSAVKALNVMNVVPELVDPTVTTIKLVGHVNYKESVQVISAADIKALVISALLQYGIDNLQMFGNTFSYSKALQYIDQANPVITNSFFRISMISPVVVLNGNTFSWDINFGNKLRPGTISSDPFTLSVESVANTLYYFEDDSLGNIKIFGVVDGDITTKFYTGDIQGNINYETGKVSLSNLQLVPYLDPYNIGVSVEPFNYDVSPGFNQILTLNQSQIIVDALPVQ